MKTLNQYHAKLIETEKKITDVRSLVKRSDTSISTENKLKDLHRERERQILLMGIHLKYLRAEKLGYTQSEMAKLLGYGNKKDISRIENGHRKMSNQVIAHINTIEQYCLNELKSKIK